MDARPWSQLAKQKDAKNNGHAGELSTMRRHFRVGTRGTTSSRDVVCPGRGRIVHDGEGPATFKSCSMGKHGAGAR